MDNPLPIGTKTDKGTVRSYKYVRFGFSKYRYRMEDGSSVGEDEIKEVYRNTKK